MPQEWFVRRGENEKGPFTSQELKQLVAKGTIVSSDFARAADKSDWREAGTIKGLFGSKPTKLSTPPPLPKPESQVSVTMTAKSTRPPLPESPMARTPIRKVPQIPSSNSTTAQLIIFRRPKMTGFMVAVSVSVDGHCHGTIGGGLLSGLIDLLTSKENSLTLLVSPGNHTVDVSGGGLKGSMNLNMSAGCDHGLITFFSNLGVLGGGLRLEALPKVAVESKYPKPQVLRDKRWSVKGIMKIALLCIGVSLPLLGAIRGFVESGKARSPSEVNSVDVKQRGIDADYNGVLTAEFYPFIQGTSRQTIKSLHLGEMKIQSRQEVSHEGEGVIQIRTLDKFMVPVTGETLPLDDMQEKRYQIRNGYVEIGQRFENNPWFYERVIKIGAGVGDSWTSDTGPWRYTVLPYQNKQVNGKAVLCAIIEMTTTDSNGQVLGRLTTAYGMGVGPVSVMSLVDKGHGEMELAWNETLVHSRKR